MAIKSKFKLFALSIALILSFSGCKNLKSDNGLAVTKWDNFYDGKNIHFYYEEFKNSNIEELNRSYQLNGKIGSDGDELDRSIKIVQWMKTLMEYDKGSVGTKEDVLSILKELENSKKASDREFSIVFSQSSTAVGLYARRGEFRVKDAAATKGDDYYKVSEIWSSKYNKWIMMDPSEGVYVKKGDTPLSAIELVENGLADVEVVGTDKAQKYIDKLNKFIYSYSILIDNSIYGKKRSNTFITFIKPGELPELKVKQGYIPPTIFVNNSSLLNVSPRTEYKDDKSDKIPTLVIMKKAMESSEKDDKTFVVGTFMNSVMLQNYYLKINENEWKKVEMYTDMTFTKGKNTIKLSTNGSDVLREVVIEDN